MTTDTIPLVFEISVAPNGCRYACADNQVLEEVPLEKRSIGAESWESKRVSLSDVDQGAAFLNFAELDLSPDNVLEYVSEHGTFGAWGMSGELYHVYATKHDVMNKAIRSWQRFASAPNKEFKKWITAKSRDELMSSLLTGTNDRINLFEPDGPVALGVGLWTVMVCQFLNACRRGEPFEDQFGTCVVCGRHWARAVTDVRTGRRYCSPRCNWRAWKERQKAEAKK